MPGLCNRQRIKRHACSSCKCALPFNRSLCATQNRGLHYLATAWREKSLPQGMLALARSPALGAASRGLDRMAHGLAARAAVRVEHTLAPREHRVVRLEQGGRADALGHHEEAEHDDVGVQRRLAAQERLLAERGAQRLQRGAEGGQLAGALALRADLRGQEGQPRRASALPGLPALPVRECRPMA